MKVILYDEGVGKQLDIEEITQYLAQNAGKAEIEVRDNPLSLNLPQDEVTDFARAIASSKVQEIHRKMEPGQEPFYGEVEYEKRRILAKTRAFGVIYDGFHLSRILVGLIPREERRLEVVNIFLTNRLFATWDDGDKRYHLRASVYSIPSIISTTGLVEAPAKPREYYLLKQQHDRLGKDLTGLKDKFKGRFIDYDDERLTEVVKGYVMQAVFYSLTGDPFCEDKCCRLYNAHWQEEVILAQLESRYEFCQRHTRVLDSSRRR